MQWKHRAFTTGTPGSLFQGSLGTSFFQDSFFLFRLTLVEIWLCFLISNTKQCKATALHAIKWGEARGGEKEERCIIMACSKLLTELLNVLFVCLPTLRLYSENWKWQSMWPTRFPSLELALDTGPSAMITPVLVETVKHDVGTRGWSEWPRTSFVQFRMLWAGKAPQHLKHQTSWAWLQRSLPACQPPGLRTFFLSALTHTVFHTVGFSFKVTASRRLPQPIG